ncbi:MAG TPA: haloacid dehalogenase [Cyanothece sp. UBA12306]|nr:haloacid dehalogenase [Cyanothece sp. UBA12306]
MSIKPQILALDFDGVICDGLLEYFQTTQRTYAQIWTDTSVSLLGDMAESFYQLRPVIETGWEMPILLRALILGYDKMKIELNWPKICQEIVTEDNLNQQEMMAKLDGVRDNWINNDLDGWLQLHRFYPGILQKLNTIINSSTLLYIVTTKEGRFVQQLLQQKGVELPKENILGKEVKQPKYETLRQLLPKHNQVPSELWFVEDLLKTLEKIQQQPDLQEVKLFLADWGYNTQKNRNIAQNKPGINLLSLERFNQDYSQW